ncbi:hypothetical protein [Schleiferilactobacillus harbinensis]|uniref:Uncharacterized protein n=1 Tax=Schleiferilactobacillus harbinensis TaxID=304207 RepID=A0A5P8M9K5_9LACO|nr:hypothetical protein [Schleiferilactobacillus harbinensis]QFR25109.1 hypothetical protein D1010_17905 [Schleiferilactobacillus harbinensis]
MAKDEVQNNDQGKNPSDNPSQQEVDAVYTGFQKSLITMMVALSNEMQADQQMSDTIDNALKTRDLTTAVNAMKQWSDPQYQQRVSTLVQLVDSAHGMLKLMASGFDLEAEEIKLRGGVDSDLPTTLAISLSCVIACNDALASSGVSKQTLMDTILFFIDQQ